MYPVLHHLCHRSHSFRWVMTRDAICRQNQNVNNGFQPRYIGRSLFKSTLRYRIKVTLFLFFFTQKVRRYRLIQVLFLLFFQDLVYCYFYIKCYFYKKVLISMLSRNIYIYHCLLFQAGTHLLTGTIIWSVIFIEFHNQ